MTQKTAEQDAQFAAEWNPDVSASKVAAVYAESLLGAATTKNVAPESLLEELDSLIDDLYAAFPRFETVMKSAMIGAEEKIAIIDRVFGNIASVTFVHFLKVVAKHGRLDILRDIRWQAHSINDTRRGRVPVTVTTATPLGEEDRTQLKQTITQIIGGEPIFHEIVQPDVLGGIVLRIGDTIYDASIHTQLKTLRQRIIDRSAHEIQSRRDCFRYSEGN